MSSTYMVFFFFHCSNAIRPTRKKTNWEPEPWKPSGHQGLEMLPKTVCGKNHSLLAFQCVGQIGVLQPLFFSLLEHTVLLVSWAPSAFCFIEHTVLYIALPPQSKVSAIKISSHLSIPCFIACLQNILTWSFSLKHSLWLTWAHSACLDKEENR